MVPFWIWLIPLYQWDPEESTLYLCVYNNYYYYTWSGRSAEAKNEHSQSYRTLNER